MEEVTLQAVLAARDARAAAQRRLLASWGRPLLSVTLNIAGPVKRWALTDFVFRDVLEALEDCLGADLLWKEQTEAVTGLEAVLVCGREAGALKDLAVELETARAAGRLYDLDVIAPDGCKLSRGTPRACLVCGGPAAPCARSRAHGLEAVRAATEDLLRRGAAESLGNLAVEALIAEVDLTPKPGLVDRRNNGAHRDMDRELFHRSARALEPYFRHAAELGMERADCMAALQSAGRAAEGAMLEATGGVNTHRGAVYACGILTAALGSVLVRGGDVLETAASLARAGTPPSGIPTAARPCGATARRGPRRGPRRVPPRPAGGGGTGRGGPPRRPFEAPGGGGGHQSPPPGRAGGTAVRPGAGGGHPLRSGGGPRPPAGGPGRCLYRPEPLPRRQCGPAGGGHAPGEGRAADGLGLVGLREIFRKIGAKFEKTVLDKGPAQRYNADYQSNANARMGKKQARSRFREPADGVSRWKDCLCTGPGAACLNGANVPQ